jgi:hypothetical protein
MKKVDGNYSRKRYQCPDCQAVMRTLTLKMKMSAYQLGAWTYSSIRVWSGPKNRFYERLSMDKIVKRVKQHNMANDFWDGWNDAKTWDRARWNAVVDNAFIPQIQQSKLVKVFGK